MIQRYIQHIISVSMTAVAVFMLSLSCFMPSAPIYASDRTTANHADSITLIEDFTIDSIGGSIVELQRKLALDADSSLVRLAFFGDSFIEADILTADVREQLQSQFGGRGIGFVPFAWDLSRFRPTVKHTHSGWQSYNILKRKSAPLHLQDKFYVSGVLSIPSEGATVRYEGVDYKDHIAESDRVRLLFSSGGATQIKITINDSIVESYKTTPSSDIQQIVVDHKDISSLDLQLYNVEGFVGYGVFFESSTGVCVDNYSVRSCSGTPLLNTSQEVNRQVSTSLNYDAIVLQYGLNIMSKDILKYTSYGSQLERLVAYVKSCFPGVPIIIMSISDRCYSSSGEYVSMPGAKAMMEQQRSTAQSAGVNFWNTLEAMARRGGMVNFVRQGWAGKDHTHIGFAGGKVLGRDMAEALMELPTELLLRERMAADSAILTPFKYPPMMYLNSLVREENINPMQAK